MILIIYTGRVRWISKIDTDDFTRRLTTSDQSLPQTREKLLVDLMWRKTFVYNSFELVEAMYSKIIILI